jgi:hypothetical protein
MSRSKARGHFILDEHQQAIEPALMRIRGQAEMLCLAAMSEISFSHEQGLALTQQAETILEHVAIIERAVRSGVYLSADDLLLGCKFIE